LHDHLRQAVEGKSRVQLESASLEKLVRATRQGQRSIALAVLSAATLLAAALLSTLEPGQAPQLFGLPIAPLLGGVALALGLLALRPK
ncbi:MAG: hypothetical protein KDI51_20740, partial [Xanthomonadales bacterium]|nr:hypothetical protein [Xanthomonadales bacterium]